MATILAIVVAVIVYVLAVLVLKIFTKKELKQIPYGEKLCTILEKMRIY